MMDALKEAKAIKEVTNHEQEVHAIAVCNALAAMHTKEADKQFTRITNLMVAMSQPH
jgi:hypothetical protein